MTKKCALFIIAALLLIPLLGIIFPNRAEAIPAWARKYDADCSLCHSPAVPRLNKTGQKFRWRGFRMADEVGQAQDISKVGHFISLRGRARAEYQNNETAEDSNQFVWHDTTLFYAGALSESLSSFSEIEVEDGEINIVAQIQGISGKSDHFTTLRIGQFHSMQGAGIGGFDRPTGVSRAEPLNSRSLTTSGIPFRIRENQKGIEVAHVRGNSRILAQVVNGLGVNGNSGVAGDQDRDKDFVLAYERIHDDNASGFTLYGYRGVWHNGAIGALGEDFRFYRYGALGNKIFDSGTEIIGAYFRSEDTVPENVGPDVQGDSFYVEFEHYLKDPDTTLLARYDWIDPDDSTKGDTRHIETIGVVHTYERHLRLGMEGNSATDKGTNKTNYGLVIEAMINF